MAEKKGKKHCMFCSKEIDLDDKEQQYVLIGTYNRVQKPDDEQYFHFTCFCDWFNKKVLEKAQKNVKAMQEKAMGLFNNPMIKGVLSQIQGSGNVLSMLSTPLGEDKTEEITTNISVDEVKKKINDGRKKRSGKKRETKV